MNDNQKTRDEVLAAIRMALHDTGQPQEVLPIVASNLVFKSQEEGLVAGFTRVFSSIDGQVIRCENDSQLAGELTALVKRKGWTKVSARSQWLEQRRGQEAFEWILTTLVDGDFTHTEAGITDCEHLVAQTGSVVMSTAQPAGRAFPVYVPVHIVIANEAQLVYSLGETILQMEQRYQSDYPSAWYLMSGPSRTGDIEKTLVLGVHGPVEVYVFLVK